MSRLFRDHLKSLADQFDRLISNRLWLKVLIALMLGGIAVMLITLQVVEDKLMVTPEIARFLVPLGATINMTGTALY